MQTDNADVCDRLTFGKPGKPTRWGRLFGATQGLAIVEAARNRIDNGVDAPIVVICPDSRRAEILEAEIRFFTGHTDPSNPPAKEALNLPVLVFPERECLPYDRYTPRQEVTSARLRLLHRAPALKNAIVVMTASSLCHRQPPRSFIEGRSFFIKTGETISIDELRTNLDRSSYVAVGQVMAPGEFAVRGGIVDVFPAGSDQPFRLELFDEEVDTIRYFDPETQRTVEKVDAIELLPAREYPFDEAAIKEFRSRFRGAIEGDPQSQFAYREVSRGNVPPGLEFYLPLFFDELNTLFDFFSKDTAWVLVDDIEEALDIFDKETEERFEHASIDAEHRVLPPQTLFIDGNEVLEALTGQSVARLSGRVEDKGKAPIENSATTEITVDSRSETPYAPLVDHLIEKTTPTLISTESAGRREALESVLRAEGIKPQVVDNWPQFINKLPDVALISSPLERGMAVAQPEFELLAEAQFYAERAQTRRRRSQTSRDPESIIRNLAELEHGAPVVHDIQGVGRYMGLSSLEIGDNTTEFLTLEYQNGDKLYVPVLSIHLVSRYVGGSPESAPLHKLGTDTWEKAKKRARLKAYDVAAELLEVEALRGARKGIEYKVPADHYSAFAANFGYEETPDQEQAILDVLEDMQSEKPMDRLVCGDVGFGKTEVAIRAAYVAVLGGRQVGLLVPTTLLAQQHYDNFRERFADQAVEIELVSRFRTKKAVDEIVGRLGKGKPDILIGTHRLLQKDIKFEKLGLIIIDEEHRFGVRQKERLKRLRAEVDILTLTATPIPRTLNLAMSGMREISIIATPPPDRMAIKTFVNEWSDGLVREAIQRELRRGGQVYVLHNEVRTIGQMADELAKLIPEADIGIGHGQLSERELEQVMNDFYHRRHNVLLCTTIIESGIDIPTANTIIINRADKFGLAQLHQLRGRVGRSHIQAYAYLITPPRKSMTSDARKRLEAIGTLEELGSGFSLASHDLEIRGAGELLGESQSGSIDDVGFSLYVDYLNKAITALRENDGKMPDVKSIPVETAPAEINLHLPARFDETYIPDVHLRLVMYKRIASAPDIEMLRELQIETIDRFGLIPEAGKNIFRLTALKIKCANLGITNIDIGAGGGKVVFNREPNIDADALVNLMQEYPDEYAMESQVTLRIKTQLEEDEERLQAVDAILDDVSA